VINAALANPGCNVRNELPASIVEKKREEGEERKKSIYMNVANPN